MYNGNESDKSKQRFPKLVVLVTCTPPNELQELPSTESQKKFEQNVMLAITSQVGTVMIPSS